MAKRKIIKLIDHPLGVPFQYKDKMLIAKVSIDKGPTCRGCWFSYKKNFGGSCYYHAFACTPVNRKDRKHVIFVEQL